MKVSIYGIGNFGYALLKHLDKKYPRDFFLHAYDRNHELVRFMRDRRRHLYFHKGETISKNIFFENDTKGLLQDCDVLILAVASDSIKEVAQNIKKYIKKEIIIVNTAKALDRDSGQRISEIIKDEFCGKKYEYSFFAGGTIAKDLFNYEPLGASLVCKNRIVLKKLTTLFQSDNLFIYPTDDVIGVEYASAFKNVISILAGITKGLKFSYGTETYIISRAADEVENLVVHGLGGNRKTFFMGSQCWGNDLWMSCMGNTRNRELGILIGGGMKIEEAILKMKNNRKSVEGVNTVNVLSKIKGIEDYYILNLIIQLFNGKINLVSFKDLIFNNKF